MVGDKTVFFYVSVNPMGTHNIGGPLMRFLKLKEVMQKAALSRSAIYRKMDEGSFPKSVSLGERAVAWIENEVEECLRTRMVAM